MVAAGGAGLCCEGAGAEAAGRAPGRAEVGGGLGSRWAGSRGQQRLVGRRLLRAQRRALREAERGPSSPSDPTPGAALGGDSA